QGQGSHRNARRPTDRRANGDRRLALLVPHRQHVGSEKAGQYSAPTGAAEAVQSLRGAAGRATQSRGQRTGATGTEPVGEGQRAGAWQSATWRVQRFAESSAG